LRNELEGKCGHRRQQQDLTPAAARYGVLLGCIFSFFAASSLFAQAPAQVPAQAPAGATPAPATTPAPTSAPPAPVPTAPSPLTNPDAANPLHQATRPYIPGFEPGLPLASPAPDAILSFAGLTVTRIRFTGVPEERVKTIAAHLAQAENQPLDPDDIKRSLRQLYRSGLYDDIAVEAQRVPGGVELTFAGAPRAFIGTVGVYGAIGATMNTQLERASQLAPGTRLTREKLSRGLDQMRATLATAGFHEPKIDQQISPHPPDQLVDIVFHVTSGPQARVGKVEVSGDSGISLVEFQHYAHLRTGARVDRDTVNHALDGVLRHYQKGERLEADVKLESATYDSATRQMNYRFTATRGPLVKVIVEGASLHPERIRHLIPVYEEGAVDEDLLIEGNRRLRDYFQRLGYFDARAAHEQQTIASPGTANAQLNIIFTVQPGPRRRVEHVVIRGNHYFDTATLKDLLSAHAASPLDPHGSYSQAIVSADIAALENVYMANGFPDTKVTAETNTPETVQADHPAVTSAPVIAAGGSEPLTVTYNIDEGAQMKVGTVQIEGNTHIETQKLTPLLNTIADQLFSPQNLAGDRDELLNAYLSKGFEQVNVEIGQTIESADAHKVDVTFRITEGEQIFVRKVLTTGFTFTRPATITKAITVHAGDPLNQSALLDTQRNLYNYALFSEVNTAIENPTGAEQEKTVLLQLSEARRWTLTYGFGFEAQTGQPQNNCAGAIAGGVACNPNGKTGVSPRVIADVTRNGLLGREQSASLRGTYGLLEQSIQFLYQIPHFQGIKNFGFGFSAGYANSEDVSTYVASRLEGAFRGTESFNRSGRFLNKASTFIYEFDFRRVKVAAGTLQVYPSEISELATATRVGGPVFTWIRDTRDEPMDAHRGTFTSFQEFLSDRDFGAQAEFNRIDTTNSSYYSFDKGAFVIARSTRYGQIRAFGPGSSGIIPLPERLFSGGPTSLRGFSFNAAGPRDPETGFPIGGAGALANSTELRLPPPNLPWFGNTLSFVLFHDMGNVFRNAGDAWQSILRIHQPDRDACKTAVVTDPSKDYPSGYEPSGSSDSTGQHGPCSFNYFSHAPGVGLRYHTPVGPIRLDFSYNLNPPIYPVNINYSIATPAGSPIPPGYALDPHLGGAPHFNFFFSLGQAF
jgi:outer membrane protein assembly complex protein YaeT